MGLDLSFEKLTHVLNQDVPFEGISDLLVIETNLIIFSSFSWILDFDSSVHLCASMQDLEKIRRLREGEITLRVGNRAKVTAIAIETYSLRLPLGFSLILKDCYYVPTASRNLIFISMLV